MKSFRLPILLLVLSLAAMGRAYALTTTSFELVSTNTACLPNAAGHVTVLHKEEVRGVDTLKLEVHGLPAGAGFSVFLTAGGLTTPGGFGAVSYVGDLTTNATGSGTLLVDATIAEAFLSTRVGDPPTRVRTDLDQVVLWFAEPAEVPACFRFTGSTPFDDDGQGGPAVLSSTGTTGLEIFP